MTIKVFISQYLEYLKINIIYWYLEIFYLDFPDEKFIWEGDKPFLIRDSM